MVATITKTSARTYSRLGQSGALFGMGLMEAIDAGDDVYLLTADMGKPAGMGRFKTRFPSRHINVGIAEQNLVGVAAGLASEGHRVVASAQAAFISMRSFEQVRQYAGYMKLPLVLVGVSAGFGLTFFGNTHYAIEDIAVMRAIPGMTIVSPSDASQAAKVISAALNSGSPTYIRCTGGLNSPIVHEMDYELELGRAIDLTPPAEVTMLATGTVVAQAQAAAAILSDQGIATAVVDVHTIKPLDTECLKRHSHSRLFVTVEEHNIIGGLGGAVSEALSEMKSHPPLLRLGVKDRFFVPGDYPYLIQQARLDAASLAQDIKAAAEAL
jgi:transketolase